MYFTDRATLDTKTKRVISMRDGVLEYLGAEIGRQPEDAIFTIYRSPSTVANAAMRTNGIPIVDGHVPTNEPAPETGSYIVDSALVEHQDSATGATIAAAHTAEVTDDLVASIQSGKRQVSLGYTGELIEHPEYGLEQINIQPHHLSTEEAGRCGSSCSFIDHRAPNNHGESTMPAEAKNGQPVIHQAFHDENGEVNMQAIVEIASSLPEAIKQVPLEKLQEVMPQLQELVAMSGAAQTQGEDSDYEDEEKGEEYDDANEEEHMADKAPEKQGYTDAQVRKFVDAQVQAKVKEHAGVIQKARRFLDEQYDFTDKSTEQIMRDAVATETTESFSDHELPLAFKMLKPSQARKDVETFGDRNPDAASTFQTMADKEI